MTCLRLNLSKRLDLFGEYRTDKKKLVSRIAAAATVLCVHSSTILDTATPYGRQQP